MKEFNISLQFAHHLHEESEDRMGSAEEAIDAFNAFDWRGEFSRATELQRVSPTLAVTANDGSLIWFSIAGADPELEFVTDFRFNTIKKRLFGLGEKEVEISFDSSDFSKSQCRKALTSFVIGEYDSVGSIYRDA